MKVWQRPWDALLDWLDQLRWDWERRSRLDRGTTRCPVDRDHCWYGWPTEPHPGEQ